jgi:hypothetical protein
MTMKQINERSKEKSSLIEQTTVSMWSVCVCVCVCEREREREKREQTKQLKERPNERNIETNE